MCYGNVTMSAISPNWRPAALVASAFACQLLGCSSSSSGGDNGTPHAGAAGSNVSTGGAGSSVAGGGRGGTASMGGAGQATAGQTSGGQSGGVGGNSANGAGGAINTGGGAAGSGGTATACAASLKDRITSTELTVEAPIAYTASTVYDAYTFDQRLQLAARAEGDALLAWVEAGSGQTPKDIRVTPLSASLQRAGDDAVVAGNELSGLVPQSDGFAVLVRDLDPGPSVALNDGVDNNIDYAATLVRVRNGKEAFRVPLTGKNAPTPSDNYTLFLYGSLRWDGTRYGAYFDTRGGMGSAAQGHNGDRLTYMDDSGHQVKGGWDWGCSHSYRRALFPIANADFFALCVSDAYPQLGLQVVNSIYTSSSPTNPALDLRDLTQLYDSVAQLPDGSFAIVWGSTHADNQPTDLAFAKISADRKLVGASPVYLTSTPSVAEAYPHVALYGTDRLLVAWDELDNSTTCTHVGCDGKYVATHVRLLDFSGKFVTDDVAIPGPMNTFAEITHFPNGDLGWAFAKTATPARGVGTFNVKFDATSTIVIDRLRVCTP